MKSYIFFSLNYLIEINAISYIITRLNLPRSKNEIYKNCGKYNVMSGNRIVQNKIGNNSNGFLFDFMNFI